MTCEEKYKREHVGSIGVSINSPGCPQDHGYLPAPKDCPWPYRNASICMACWDREIPDNNEKEKKNMNEVWERTEVEAMHNVRERTSAEIEEEMERVRTEYRIRKRELEKEYEQAKKREELEAGAKEIKAIIDSYVSAGFTREEAIGLVNTCIKALAHN